MCYVTFNFYLTQFQSLDINFQRYRTLNLLKQTVRHSLVKGGYLRNVDGISFVTKWQIMITRKLSRFTNRSGWCSTMYLRM